MEFNLTGDQKLFRSTTCDLLDAQVVLPLQPVDWSRVVALRKEASTLITEENS